MSLIIPANSAAASGGYAVDNSCRFNGTNANLVRTPSSASNEKLMTMSMWVKRSKLGAYQVLWNTSFSNTQTRLYFDANDFLEFHSINPNAYDVRLITNRKFRDVSAWYNIIVAINTDDGTAADRIKIYVNGVRETSFSTENLSPDGYATGMNTANPFQIGQQQSDENYFSGYLSEITFIDGAQSAATDLGEFDEDSGIWKPIDVSGLTYGTNGYRLQFEQSGTSANSSGIGADTSGNDHHFTVVNLTAIDQTTDTCTNNFATMNPLFVGTQAITYAEGNLKTTATNQSQKNAVSTIAVSSGKWYCEMVSRNGTNYPGFGIMDSQSVLQTSISYLGSSSDSYCMFQDGNYYTNGSASNTGTSWGVGSIMGISIDLDSGTKTIKFYKNGSQTHSATIATPANAYVFAVSHNDNGTITEINFGSPPYSESGGNSDGNGYGNFSMAVPSGYYSLNTKNLSEFG